MNRKKRRAGAATTPSRPGGGEPHHAALREAVAHHQAGRLPQALAIYDRVLAAAPDQPDALYFSGAALAQAGRPAPAIERLARAVALRPDNAAAQAQLGTLLLQARRHGEAEAPLRAGWRAQPGEANLGLNLANCLWRLNRPDEAEAVVREVFERHPDNSAAWTALGTFLFAQRRLAPAEAAFGKALSLAPDDPPALTGLGLVLDAQGAPMRAAEACRRSLAARPGHALTAGNLGVALVNAGRIEEGIEAYRAALAAAPGDARTASNLLMALNYRTRPADEVFAEHRRLAPRSLPARPGDFTGHDRAPGRPLRLAILSADLRRHSVAFFLEPVLAALDREAVHVTCFAAVARPDEVTEALRAHADDWVDATALDDEALARRIREARIDIALDLSGHTRGNRLGALARRPAPVQATWLGYPNTTGTDAIGWRLVDAVTDPEGPADGRHSERLLRLPAPFLCYGPPGAAPEAGPLPAGADGPPTFASFNNWSKIGPETVAAWAGALHAVPGARLLVKARALADPAVAEDCRAAFAAHGIAGDRLEIAGWTVSPEDHLTAYRDVDIAFDTLPYNGTTTTCEALWMGVPVVTLAGDRHAARVGASLLSAVGLDDLVAGDVEGFAAIAAGLATDRERLAALRAGLRARVAASPLCDADRFARHFEAALRTMWRDWCAEQGSDSERSDASICDPSGRSPA